ncbi:phage tail tip lysozyme [uncultured Limosilactobacillus sp.]|uniref:phage tail tip lysozyme n=1 Tax=uncultured Limosilactobacillus sp. TaxID=2837629 RepID=UPI00272BBF90|nr:phage tail tip lysozyme [uncultured Limosilactobacillus sp.]
MKVNRRLGIYLAAPIALMAISVTNAKADTVSQDQIPTTVQTLPQSNGDAASSNSVAVTNSNQSDTPVVTSTEVASEAPNTSSVATSVTSATSAVDSNSVNQGIDLHTTENMTLYAKPANEEAVESTQTFNPSSQSPVSYAQLFTSLYTTNYTQQQVNNATYIHNYFINQGWTTNAIAGMLGNFVSESGLIPDLHQYGGGPGYGIAQWPASAVQGWCRNNGYDYRTLQGQCAYIQYQMTHGQQYYPSRYSRMTANEYMHSYDSAYNLGMIWLNNFERPANRNQPARGQQAQYWYQYFQNHGGTTAPVEQPTQPSTSGNGTMQQRGTFRVAYGLNVRQAPSTSSAIMARYNGGQSFTYDSKVEANGYLWVSYMSYSGARRYVAIKNLSTGQTFGTDSNNFSFNNPRPSTPTPAPTPSTPADGTTMQQRGTFRVAYGLNIRQAPSTSSAVMAQYSGGQSFTYDSKVVANGYLWVSYMSYSGARRYAAIKNLSTGQTFGTDSNNFSFNGMSTNVPSTPSQNPVNQGSKAEQIISLARQQLGKPYVYGATGPNSFDCSGLVQYVYRQVGINLPRTAAQQSTRGYGVSFNNLQPGDLLFWSNSRGVYHVGIYTGNGNTLFAP